MTVTLLPEAEEELVEAVDWYDEQNPGLGAEFLGFVERLLARVSEDPLQFPRWETNPRYRRAVLSRFPYVVVFEERGDELEVVAVAHAKRRPGYWLHRSQSRDR